MSHIYVCYVLFLDKQHPQNVFTKLHLYAGINNAYIKGFADELNDVNHCSKRCIELPGMKSTTPKILNI